MPVASLDPSLALGFLCRSPSDLAQLCVLLRAVFDHHGTQLFDVREGPIAGLRPLGAQSVVWEEGAVEGGGAAGPGQAPSPAAVGGAGRLDGPAAGDGGSVDPGAGGSGSDDEFVLL